MEIRNAKITDTMLGREDHGILTFYIHIHFLGGTCGIGGYALDEYDKEAGYRVFKAASMEAISEILYTVGVDSWEDLPGKYIRFKDNGWGSSIDEIGNIVEEKWFNIRQFFQEKQSRVDTHDSC